MTYFAAGASGCPGNCLLDGSIHAHARLLFVQMVAAIFMSGALSSVPARTTTVSGVVARWL